MFGMYTTIAGSLKGLPGELIRPSRDCDGEKDVLLARNPPSPPPGISPYTPPMDAMDRVLASMSPDDTAAALRLLAVLEECGQMHFSEADAWRRRITGWARLNAVGRRQSRAPRLLQACHLRTPAAYRLTL